MNGRDCSEAAAAVKRVAGDSLVATLRWNIAADLDLAAFCVSKKGTELVYFANLGMRASRPYVHLVADHKGNTRIKSRAETLVMTQISRNNAIHILVWDHDAISANEAHQQSRAAGSCWLTFVDRENRKTVIQAELSKGRSCILVATIAEQSINRRCESVPAKSTNDIMEFVNELGKNALESFE